MNSEAEFIAAIAAAPDDQLLYRAFADWLEERGDRRAPWVRSDVVRPWMGPAFGSPIPKLIEALQRERTAAGVRAAVAVGAAIVPELVALVKRCRTYQAIVCLRKL